MNDHNNPPSLIDDEPEESGAPAIGGETGQQLRSYIERIERLEEEKKGLSEDIKDVFAAAKSNGFDVKTMRQLIKVRQLDARDGGEQEALNEAYLGALGMP